MTNRTRKVLLVGGTGSGLITKAAPPPGEHRLYFVEKGRRFAEVYRYVPGALEDPLPPDVAVPMEFAGIEDCPDASGGPPSGHSHGA